MSRSTRFLITTIPAEAYVKDESNVNLTLQAALKEVVKAFTRLATVGVPVHDLPSRGGTHVSWLYIPLYVAYLNLFEAAVVQDVRSNYLENNF